MADGLSGLYVLSDTDLDFRKMTVAGGEPVAMVDLDHLAVAAGPARGLHAAGRCGMDVFTDGAAKVEAGVHRRLMKKWIHAHAEAGGLYEFAVQRLADRQHAKGLCQGVGLRPREIDLIDAVIEIAGVALWLDRNERAADG